MSENGSMPANESTVIGRVKWFNNQKGYGFIVRDDTPDIFVHHTAIVMDGYRTLKQDEMVQFDLVETDKGFQAHNVSRVPEQQGEQSAAQPQQ